MSYQPKLPVYIWGRLFHWLFDCRAVKEILEYQRALDAIVRWIQELLGYNFSVICRVEGMMCDDDALTRQYVKLISMHCYISKVLFRLQSKAQSLSLPTLQLSFLLVNPHKIITTFKPSIRTTLDKKNT